MLCTARTILSQDVCLSVRLSDIRGYAGIIGLCWNGWTYHQKRFQQPHHLLVFPYQSAWQYSAGTTPPLTRASNAGVWKNRDFRLISRFISKMIQDTTILTIWNAYRKPYTQAFDWYHFQWSWTTPSSRFQGHAIIWRLIYQKVFATAELVVLQARRCCVNIRNINISAHCSACHLANSAETYMQIARFLLGPYILPRDAMHSADYAVARCLSVLSVRAVLMCR